MSLPRIKPMQPFHQAVVSLSSSPPSFPLLLLLLHIQCSLLRARWAAAAASALLWRTVGDEHPSPTGCQGRLSRHLPVGLLRPSFRYQIRLDLICLPYRVPRLVIRQIRRCVWPGCPQLPSLWLGIYFGGDLFFIFFLHLQQLSAKVIDSCPHWEGAFLCFGGILRDILVLLEVVKSNERWRGGLN